MMEISDSKFQSNPHSDLKKRLDALHYCHPVTPHSAILVETLLNDIIASNEKLQILQKENSSFRADLQSALSEVRMYQSEITRLGTENNRLHLEMMKTKEQASESQEKWRVSNKKLENEKNDLKTLNEIHKVKIQELEIEKDQLKSRFESLYNKIYNPASQKSLKDANLSIKSQNSVKKQEFKLSKNLPQSETSSFSKSQQEWAQELQDSDDRVKKYQEQVEDLIKLNEDLQEDVKLLEIRVKSRDEEVARLSNLLNSGEFALKVPKRVAESNNEELIKTLNERLDLINSEFMKCEEELTVAKDRLSQVGNVHLERDVLSLKLEEASREIARLTMVAGVGNSDSGKFSMNTEKRFVSSNCKA